MRMISHFSQKVRRESGAEVGFRFYSLECELAAMRGARIPQVALTVTSPDEEPVVESVDADPDLADRFDAPAPSDWLSLLDLLRARFLGQPMGELAGRATRLLAAG